MKERETKAREKAYSNISVRSFVVVAVIIICLSTMFIKQHSAVDFFAALPVCLLAEGIVYKDRWFKHKKKVQKS